MHEAGHALLTVLLPGAAVVGSVALIVHAFAATPSSPDAERPSVAECHAEPQLQPTNWDTPPGASGLCYCSGALTECA